MGQTSLMAAALYRQDDRTWGLEILMQGRVSDHLQASIQPYLNPDPGVMLEARDA